MKKYVSIFLIVIMNFTLFTGCINNSNTQESSEQVNIISQQSEKKEQQDNFTENQLYATVIKYDNNILEIVDENSNIKQIKITLKEEVKRGYKIKLSYEENTENIKSYNVENFDNISSEQKVNQI